MDVVAREITRSLGPRVDPVPPIIQVPRGRFVHHQNIALQSEMIELLEGSEGEVRVDRVDTNTVCVSEPM